MEAAPIISYGESALADVTLGQKMLDALEYYYPNHAFFVQCNHESGCLTIQLLYEDNNQIIKRWSHGMLVHINKIGTEGEIRRRAMLDGGELLERYNLARSGANPYTRIDAKSRSIITDGVIN